MEYTVEITNKENKLFFVEVEATDAIEAIKKGKKAAFYLHDVGPDDRKSINVFMNIDARD